ASIVIVSPSGIYGPSRKSRTWITRRRETSSRSVESSKRSTKSRRGRTASRATDEGPASPDRIGGAHAQALLGPRREHRRGGCCRGLQSRARQNGSLLG